MAAGESRRMNTPKQLLNWEGISLIEHILAIVRSSKIESIIVVLGSNADLVRPVLGSYQDVTVIINHDWQKGLGSSIQKGIDSLPNNIQGVMIVLSDQPFINSDLIDLMIDHFNESSAPIIAPRVNGIQSNPVLFRGDMFADLKRIEGDRGAKQLLAQYPVEWIEWRDEKLVIDIDSQEDYQKAISSLHV